jgi:ribosomal protein S27AE
MGKTIDCQSHFHVHSMSTFSHFVIIAALLQGCTAPKCGVVIQRHSRSVDVTRHCCGKCKAKLIEIEVPSRKGSNTKQTPKKKKALSGYNLFVKQNSKLVRERFEKDEGSYGQVTQPDVMKECARLWHERNQNSPKLGSEDVATAHL